MCCRVLSNGPGLRPLLTGRAPPPSCDNHVSPDRGQLGEGTVVRPTVQAVVAGEVDGDSDSRHV